MFNNCSLIFFLLSLTSAAIHAMDPAAIELLVVGSTRSDHMPESVRILHGEPSFAYEDTIRGEKAITIDLQPSEHPGHIQADATSYQFIQKINNVYIERMYTSFGDTSSPGAHNNLIGATIKNLLPQMNVNASLVIELDPCLKFLSEFRTDNEFTAYRKANPFHAWQSYAVFLNAVLSLYEPRISSQILKYNMQMQGYSESVIEDTCNFQEHLYRWVQKIAPEMGMANKDLIEKLRQEMTIQNDITYFNEQLAPLITIVRLLPQGADLSAKEFERSFLSRAYRHIHREERDLYVRDSKAIEKDCYGDQCTFWFYDSHAFFNATDSNKLIGFLAVENNRNYIIEYLVNLGFRDVRVEFKDSPYNNRKNFWIVSAIKS